jgi:HEAT repeat protein
VPAIAGALRDPNARVRLAAAESLAQLGEVARGALEPLRQALGDPEPDVRRAVSEALLSIVPTVRDK